MAVKVLNGSSGSVAGPNWLDIFCPGLNNGCPGFNFICPGVNVGCVVVDAVCQGDTSCPCFNDFCLVDCGGSGGVHSIVVPI